MSCLGAENFTGNVMEVADDVHIRVSDRDGTVITEFRNEAMAAQPTGHDSWIWRHALADRLYLAEAHVGAQTLHAPKAYEDADATASANLSARLPYIFANCRFAHYLKCMVRDWIGSSREAPQLQADLQSWIMQYVDVQPDFSTEETKARKPLKQASVEVIPDLENPGYYRGLLRMISHYQLKGMDVSLSMVSRLPKSNN